MCYFFYHLNFILWTSLLGFTRNRFVFIEPFKVRLVECLLVEWLVNDLIDHALYGLQSLHYTNWLVPCRWIGWGLNNFQDIKWHCEKSNFPNSAPSTGILRRLNVDGKENSPPTARLYDRHIRVCSTFGGPPPGGPKSADSHVYRPYRRLLQANLEQLRASRRHWRALERDYYLNWHLPTIAL